MSDVPGDNGTFLRITNREVYLKLENVEEMLRDIKAEQAVQRTENKARDLTINANSGRLLKFETRLNGAFIGMGTGVAFFIFAVVKGVIG